VLEQERQEHQDGLINVVSDSAICKARFSAAVIWLQPPHLLQQHAHSPGIGAFESVSLVRQLNVAGTSCECCFGGILQTWGQEEIMSGEAREN
jgi:hypothetical protein